MRSILSYEEEVSHFYEIRLPLLGGYCIEWVLRKTILSFEEEVPILL